MIAQIMKKMIEYSEGNLHDINHFIKVWTYAKTIGELESLDEDTLKTLEIAAIVHDIACPLLRQKHGSCDGKLQEIEGVPLAKDFLKEFEIPKDQIEKIIYLIAHHHTFSDIDGMDYQILVEADYIANAEENGYSAENITNTYDKIFHTDMGKELLLNVFNLQREI